MVDPDREPLAGMIEVDESTIVYRTKDDPVGGGQGRSAERKMLIAAAVETMPGGKTGRIRLTTIKDYSAATLQQLVAENTVAGSTILTDGFSAYPGMRDRNHVPRVVGVRPAHSLLPWVHPVFANHKRLALGVYHGAADIADPSQAPQSKAIARTDAQQVPTAGPQRTQL